MKPIVSVITTSYNREDYIGESIESVLTSTLSDFELIVVDDCSADRTVEVARRYAESDNRIKIYVNKKNLGDYPNRNRAASYAKGKYIKYVDSDDIIYPHGLEVMVTSMEQFPDAGLGLCAIPHKFHRQPYCIKPHDAYIENFYGFGHFSRAPTSGIIKKSSFEAVGGFSGKRMIGDFELWFKMAAHFPMVSFPRDLVWNRTHPNQELNSEYAKNYSRLRKEVIDEALSSKDCPLNQNEKKEIYKRLKRQRLKNIILSSWAKLQK